MLNEKSKQETLESLENSYIRVRFWIKKYNFANEKSEKNEIIDLIESEKVLIKEKQNMLFWGI